VKPAVWPRDEARLLQVDPVARTVSDRRLPDLPTLLRANDVLVVNDAATLPASLSGSMPAPRPPRKNWLNRSRKLVPPAPPKSNPPKSKCTPPASPESGGAPPGKFSL